MDTLNKIRCAIVARIPGTVAYEAMTKRRIERELRAAGYSRSHAVAEAARIFKDANHV